MAISLIHFPTLKIHFHNQTETDNLRNILKNKQLNEVKCFYMSFFLSTFVPTLCVKCVSISSVVVETVILKCFLFLTSKRHQPTSCFERSRSSNQKRAEFTTEILVLHFSHPLSSRIQILAHRLNRVQL